MIPNRVIFGALLLLSYVGSFAMGCLNHILGSDGSGWFFTPNHPNDYHNGANCKLLIDASVPIIISFTHFSLETCCDWLKIYDGPTEASDLLIKTSTFPDSSILTTANKVLVTFTTDGSDTSSGFQATYSPFRCQYITSSGWFTSPSHPLDYPNDLNCWLINAKGPIILSFTRFQTEANKDWLTVYDGPTPSSVRLLRSSWNYTIPSSIVSSAHQILVTFISDGSNSFSGFNATYSPYYQGVTIRPIECNGTTFIDSSGFVLTSLSYPYNYPDIRCNWHFVSDPGTTIQISFTDFSTRPEDYVSIYDGRIRSDFTNRLMIASGINASSLLSCNYFTKSNELHVAFNPVSNTSVIQMMTERKRFRAIITTSSSPNGCGGEHKFISAKSCLNRSTTIKIPEFRNIDWHFKSPRCVWRIQVDAGSQINLTLSNNIGLVKISDSYSLEVYEGRVENSEDNLLANVTRISSFQHPFFVVSKSNEMTVVLKDNKKYVSNCQPRDYPKLNFTYEAITTSTYGCFGRMNLNTKKLLPPPSNDSTQSTSLRCKWRIGGHSGSDIAITSFNNSIYYDGKIHDTLLAVLLGS